MLRNDLLLVDEVGFAALDDTGTNCCSGSSPPPANAPRSASPSHWPFDQWGRFLPEHAAAVSLLDRLPHHASVVATNGNSYRMCEAPSQRRNHPQSQLTNPTGGDFCLATNGDHAALATFREK